MSLTRRSETTTNSHDRDYHAAADRRGSDRLLSDLVRPVPVAGPEDSDGDEDDPADFGEPLRQASDHRVGLGVSCYVCGRLAIEYVVPLTGHRALQHLCDHCYRKHAAPCDRARRQGGGQ